MIYIFEDNFKNSSISKLFLESYKDKSYILDSKGESRIIKLAENMLRTTDDYVAVFIDFVPNNRSIYATYGKLTALHNNFDNRLIVIPIVCAEYYYILSLENSGLIKDRSIFDIVKNKKPYWNTPLNGHSEKWYKTFEKFCKLFCDLNLKECASIPRDKPDNNWYTTDDCVCSNCNCGCDKQKLVIDKSLELLSKYPCVPIGSVHEHTSISVQDAWKIHRMLIDEFNKLVDTLKEHDPSENTFYEYASYIE